MAGLHGHAEVVAVEQDDLVALQSGIQLGELLQRSAHAFSVVASSSLRSTSPKSHSSTQVTGGTSRWARVMCCDQPAARPGGAARAVPPGSVQGLTPRRG